MSSWSAVCRLGPYTLAAIIWRANVRCTWCGREVAKGDYAIDHLVPRALGGSDSPSNLVLACPTCNTLKSDSPGVPASLLSRILEAGRTEQQCWAEAERQTAVLVGRGTWANKSSRLLAMSWFGEAIKKDLENARRYKARVADELRKVPF